MKIALLALAAAPLATLGLDCEGGLGAAKAELATLNTQVKEQKSTVQRWKKATKTGVLYDIEGQVVGECVVEGGEPTDVPADEGEDIPVDEDVDEDEESEEVDCKELKRTKKSLKSMMKTAGKAKYKTACDTVEGERTKKQQKDCEFYTQLTGAFIPDAEEYIAFLEESC